MLHDNDIWREKLWYAMLTQDGLMLTLVFEEAISFLKYDTRDSWKSGKQEPEYIHSILEGEITNVATCPNGNYIVTIIHNSGQRVLNLWYTQDILNNKYESKYEISLNEALTKAGLETGVIDDVTQICFKTLKLIIFVVIANVFTPPPDIDDKTLILLFNEKGFLDFKVCPHGKIKLFQ